MAPFFLAGVWRVGEFFKRKNYTDNLRSGIMEAHLIMGEFP